MSQQADIIGTITFDENTNIIQCTGIGESRTSDVTQLSSLQLDNEGFGMVKDQSNGITISLYRKDDMTVATYAEQ